MVGWMDRGRDGGVFVFVSMFLLHGFINRSNKGIVGGLFLRRGKVEENSSGENKAGVDYLGDNICKENELISEFDYAIHGYLSHSQLNK